MTRRRWISNLALLVGSLLVCLLLGEIGARIYFAGTSDAGKDQVLEGSLTEHDSLLGFRLRRNARAKLAAPEFSIPITTNSHGLRESEEIAYEKPPGRYRILLCGDSFTFGHGVNEEDRYGERLAALLDSVEVINQGVPGTGTDQQLLLYREEGAKYQPDLVILAYFVENIVRNVTTVRFTIDGEVVYKPRFLVENGDLVLTNVPVPDPRIVHEPEEEARAFWEHASARRSLGVPIPFKRYLRQHSAFYKLLHASMAGVRRRFAHGSPFSYPEYQEGREEWAVTRAIIRAFAAEARDHGSEFLLVVVPEREFVYDRFLSDQPFAALTEFARQEGIPILDLLPVFENAVRERRGRLYYSIDAHWTPEGHALAAEAIAAHLVRGVARTR